MRDGFLLFSSSFKISFLIILTLVHIRDSSYTAPTICDLEPPYRVVSGDCWGARTKDGGGEDAAKVGVNLAEQEGIFRDVSAQGVVIEQEEKELGYANEDTEG